MKTNIIHKFGLVAMVIKIPLVPKSILFITCFCILSPPSFAQNEADFYEQKNYVDTKTLIVSDSLDNNGNNGADGTDSEILQNLINQGTALDDNGTKGRRIIIPAGKYYLKNVNLRSNIHLRIDEEATLYIADPSDSNQMNMFFFGKDNFQYGTVRNVSITSRSGRFTVDLTTANMTSTTPFKIGNTENFKLAGVNITDKRTKFQSIGLGPVQKLNGGYGCPKDGVIKDITVDDADYGYGLVQMHCGDSVLFKNLESTGGTTLRFETDYLDGVNEAGSKIVENVVARNITCIDGNTAVTLSPHERENGIVDVQNVTADNCGWAVRVERSFSIASGKTLGRFDSLSIIRDVDVIYGTNATVKKSHLDKFTCSSNGDGTYADYTLETQSLFTTGNVRYRGPSIGGVLYDGGYEIDFDPNKNFHLEIDVDSIPRAIYEQVSCSSSNSSRIMNAEPDVLSNFGLSIYPNPTANRLYLKSNEDDIISVSIYDVNGSTIYLTNTDTRYGRNLNIDISHFLNGIYIIRTRLTSGEEVTTRFLKQ